MLCPYIKPITYRWAWELMPVMLQCIYWNQEHPDHGNQSDGRTETIDSNIFQIQPFLAMLGVAFQ